MRTLESRNPETRTRATHSTTKTPRRRLIIIIILIIVVVVFIPISETIQQRSLEMSHALNTLVDAVALYSLYDRESGSLGQYCEAMVELKIASS